ncbi:polysaccharide export outer membrane protein [Altererythrobacter xiamenensis]|uniref:Polysaccharide export outer membrane protein n=1 Tax=Altererythrobacter xiamenensis TaxID=1316679 RepID=A0A1Y6F3L4_9SPHN|nr:polysaccharide biosynthesis/export family protein [Altererythrobacter xiamenensis]SMQ69086.1 polysaccharide export outer membrane protein [Altererythrobacter xiamenensis]
MTFSLAGRGLFLALLPLIAGCSTARPLEGPTAIEVVQADALPPPAVNDLGVVGRSFVIGPYDKLKVSVFGIQELQDFEAVVDGGGNISFPLAGSLEAGGKTSSELAEEIAKRLGARYIRDPQVSVNLEENNSKVYAVTGQVGEPGLYPVRGQLTLIGAVAQAKGLTEFAKAEYVVVFRKVEGKQMAALYNLEAIQRGAYEDPQVFANDRIVVSTNRARRVFRDILSGAPLLTTPIIAVLTSNNN